MVTYNEKKIQKKKTLILNKFTRHSDEVDITHLSPSYQIKDSVPSTACREQLIPSKPFGVLQTFEMKCLAKVKNDGYETHLIIECFKMLIKCFMHTVY